MEKMRTYIILFTIIVVLAGAIYLVSHKDIYFNSQEQQSGTTKGPSQKVIVTEDNFAQYLSTNEAVFALPSKSSIQLSMGDKQYVVTTGNVKEGTVENPDITVYLPSKYITEFSNGFCATLRKAKNNGDLRMELHISKTSAAWKFKSMYEYRDCVGI